MERNLSTTRKTAIAITCLSIGCASAGLRAAPPLTVVENGQTRAVIAIDAAAGTDDARAMEAKAADELAHYIELMSGARPELADDPEAIEAALAADMPVFLVGELALRTRPELNERLNAVVNPDPLVIGKQSVENVERADGIVLLRDGNRIYLAGSNPRSHYYSVARLLNLWGCRWYMPTEFGECIPEIPTLSLTELDEAYASPFEIRKYWLSWNASRQGYDDFLHRNFMNNEGFVAAHVLQNYVRELVPEGGTAYNVPIAEPETIEHIADQLDDAFAVGGKIRLGMNDGLYSSDSDVDELLRANMYDKYFQAQMLTDNFMAMHNGVARILQERHPDSTATITFFSYGNITIPPQRKMYAERSLVTELAPIDIDPIHHMDDPRSPPRQEYRDMMHRWSEIMDGRVQIYEYDQGMLVWRDLPNPSHHVFRHDIQHYRDAGVLGFSTESRGATATTFLNLFFRGQLKWNPDTDVDAMLEEFYPKFYGPAADAMAAYWGALFQAWEDTIVTEHEFYLIPAVYTDALVEELRGHLADGTAAVAALRARDPETLSRNERLYIERMTFTEKSFALIDHYTAMVRAGAREGDYAAAETAGRAALETRIALAEMNPTFTTRVVGPAAEPREPGGGAPWLPGEVKQYIDLREKTDGTTGTLVAMLPLEWAYRRDPNDTGLPRGFARQEADLTYWNANKDRYATPETRKDYPITEWEMLRSDLYAQAQGVLHPDWQSFTGFMWYKTDVPLDAAQAAGTVHVHFPGLFSEAWLYVNGYLVAHRPQKHMWWHNSYRFEWDVDISGHLREGDNDITLRVHNTHHNGGLFRRPFLCRPVE